MPTARDDSYSVASGAVLYMGNAPPIQLTSTHWTPNRDAQGNVVQSDGPQLPTTWRKVGGSNTTIQEVLESPGYTNNSAGLSAPGIVVAWGGAARDYINDALVISGGGHGDSSAAETGIYTALLKKMRIERTVNRQPSNTPLTYSGSGIALTSGEPWPGGFNLPLSSGVPGSMHTYDGLVWIPPTTMATLGLSAPNRGGLFYPGDARCVVNLDTGAYSKLWWKSADMDWSYCTAILDGTLVIGPRQYFNWWRFDLSQTETTDWQSSGYDSTPAVPSFGKKLAAIPSSAAWNYNHKAQGWLRERREYVHFFGNQQARRFRYGQALDASATAFGGYMDDITLTSANGTDHLDFSATNLQDTGTNQLCSAGVAYDHTTQAIYVCANKTDGAIYKITGLSGTSWTVLKLSNTAPLTVGAQGTYGRFALTRIGGALIGVRVTSISNPIEVIRLQ